ncbi:MULTISPECIES: TauD/TfdA family dioxygenase [unclassified Nonomuraea]|uniref:TauD/TfdA family dioxygenase n=1 Tax=unclassified Nonomuraea TaxID=2593643 RepID=UPI0033F1D122
MNEMNLTAARRHLADHGWAVLRTSLCFADGEAVDHARVLSLARRFGTPSRRDAGREIWPVRPSRTDASATFSERAGAVDFHTDAAYRPRPEDLVCMFVVRPARDGGLTLLLDAATVDAGLRRHDLGERVLAALAEPRWRWRVPETFSGGPADVSPRAAVMPGDGTVRWRGDNLVGLTQERRTVAFWFGSLLRVLPGAVRLEHRPGDVIVIDNHRVMHARTSFQDPHRLLLRVRLWAS